MKFAANSRLLAVDPSLRSTGWVLFSVVDCLPIAAGVLSPPGSKELLAKRLEILQRDVEELFVQFGLGIHDVTICEGPAPVSLNPDSALKVEHVRGIFETVSRTRGVQVPGRINPRTVQVELLGMRGQQLSRGAVKEWAKETAVQLYGKELLRLFPDSAGTLKGVSQDIIDALLIGTVATAKLKVAAQCGADIASLLAPRPKARRGRRMMR